MPSCMAGPFGANALMSQYRHARAHNRRMWSRLGGLLFVAACAAGDAAFSGVPSAAALFADGPHKGMSYAHAMRRGRGYGSPDSAGSLRALQALGVEWISITPFGFQRDPA